MADGGVLIAGLARNCATSLTPSLAAIDRLRSVFPGSRSVVVTNDNEDDTDGLLEAWAHGSADRTLLSLDGLAAAVPERVVRIAHARNAYIGELRRRQHLGESFDLLIVADLDGPNANLVSGDALKEIIQTAPTGWAALFANQRTSYYDIYALRHRAWCPRDCWTEVDTLKNTRNSGGWSVAIERFVGSRQVHIRPSERAIRVASAFGGFAVYRTEFLNGAEYRSHRVGQQQSCEHVSFNRQCAHNGGRLYVMPRLLNDTPIEHLSPGHGAHRRPWARWWRRDKVEN